MAREELLTLRIESNLNLQKNHRQAAHMLRGLLLALRGLGLSISTDAILIAGKFAQTHRAAGVELVG